MKYSELPQEYQDLEIPENAKKNYFDDTVDDYHFYWGYTNEGALFWSKCCDAKTIDDLPPLPNTLSKEAQKHLDNALQSSKKQAYGYKGDILVDNIEKEFVLPKKWCVKAEEGSNIHRWFEKKLDRVVGCGNCTNIFHYPQIDESICTDVNVCKGYTEITSDQWVKYVRDAELKNDNIELIKEIRDVVNDKEPYQSQKALNLSTLKELKELQNKIFQKMDNDIEPISEVKEHIEPFYMIYVDDASGSTKKHDRNIAIIEAQSLSKETNKKVFILRSEYCFERKVDINLIPIKKD